MPTMPSPANLGTPLLIASSRALFLEVEFAYMTNSPSDSNARMLSLVAVPGPRIKPRSAFLIGATAISKAEAAAELIKLEVICRAEYGGRSPPPS
jgi:hypothetical protein